MSCKSFFLILLFPFFGNAQSSLSDIFLRLDFSSAEQLIELSEGKTNNINRFTELKGTQIAAATSVLLARENFFSAVFKEHLELFYNNSYIQKDIFGLTQTRTLLPHIKALLSEIKKRSVDKRVLATLSAFFPSDAKISGTIPVYFVAMGNENATAFVRRVVWKDGTPIFVGHDEGETIIVVNLAKIVQYNAKTEIHFIETLSTLAHECFHALFSMYQQNSPQWKTAREHSTPTSVLTELVQNEGIAYYISLQQQLGGETPPTQWFTETTQALQTLQKILDELSSPNLTSARARELIMNANLSGSFQKNYGATAGLRMAYEIDTKLGRKVLTETIKNGTEDFFEKYLEVAKQYGLPEIKI